MKYLVIFLFVVLSLNTTAQTAVKKNSIEVQGRVINGIAVDKWNSTSVKINDTISITDILTLPIIYTAASDTSAYPTPGKAGDIFINTTAGKVYISKSALRGGWLILN